MNFDEIESLLKVVRRFVNDELIWGSMLIDFLSYLRNSPNRQIRNQHEYVLLLEDSQGIIKTKNESKKEEGK